MMIFSKARIFLSISFAVIVLSSVRAQDQPADFFSSTAQSASSIPQSEAVDVQKKFSELSMRINERPDIQKLRAEMTEAQNAYTVAFRAAITKADPDILAKVDALNKSMLEVAKSGPAPRVRPGFAQLSPEERTLLLNTRTAALDTPEVKSARNKRNAAKTDDERKSAEVDYRAILRKTMLEINAKVGPLLDEYNPVPAPAITPDSASSPTKEP